jgi:hypothetical protein
MRKYLTDWRVVGATLGVVPVVRATIASRGDRRLLLLWGAWAVGLAIAVMNVQEKSKARESDLEP